MGTVYPNRGGWFDDQKDSTGSSSVATATRCALAASLISLSVFSGTGASANDLEQLRNLQTNGPIVSNPIKVCTVESSPARSSVENLERIRSVFAPAVSDLAKTFNVSRQTIYNWLNGEQPTIEHTAKLKDLALAADTFAGAGIKVSGILLKRKITDGKNMFEVVQSGGSAADAAQLLMQIIKRESEQKERLAARYAGRTASQTSADSDLMAANDVV
jgi:DNA-binding transcriptional regulator YiaG